MDNNQQSNFKKQISNIQKFVSLSLSKGQIFSALFTLLFPILTYSQVVDEIIPLDTTSEIIQVIYEPTETESYYQKKIAVFANNTSQIAIEKTYARGVQNGIYKAYYPDGKIKVKTVYANGKINGEWTWYNPEGKILIKGIYVDGVKHGYWAYKNIKTYGRFKKGLMHRTWYVLDANQYKTKSTYKNGELVKGDGVSLGFILVADTNYVQNDTLIVEATQPIEMPITAGTEYQQAIDFLASNFIFRKNIKAYFKKDIQQFKKNYKRDVFQFNIARKVPSINIDLFLEQSKNGQIEVSLIDSALKNNTDNYKKYFSSTNIQFNNGIEKQATNPEAPVLINFSEVNQQLLAVDVVWKIKEEYKTFKILLYFDEEGTLKAAEYQK